MITSGKDAHSKALENSGKKREREKAAVMWRPG